MNQQKQHRFAVYLEGIRVPCAAASISTQVDGPAVASITLVPTESSFYAPERTLVHIFWHDSTDEKTFWRCIFIGEVIGKSFSYMSGGRKAIYKCRDFTTYWEQAHEVFFANYVPAGGGPTDDQISFFFGSNVFAREENRADPSTQNTTRTQAKVSIGNLLTNAFGEVQSLGQGFQSIFDHLGGTAEIGGVNDYWIFSEGRLKLRSHIFTVDNPRSLEILKEGLANVRSDFNLSPVDHASAWQIVQIIISRLYYQLICNPAAPYFRARPGTEEGIRNINLGSPDDVARGLGNIANYIIMPDIYFAQPPRCNVLFPSMVTQFQYSDSFTVGPTRTLAHVAGFKGVGGRTFYAPSDVKLDTDQTRSVLTAEEKIRGFIPRIIHVSPAEVKGGIDDDDNNLAHIVNYRHWLENYKTRQGGGTGPFNPYLAVGFPAAVVDRVFGFVVGSLRTVQHDLDFNTGQTYTTFQLGLCRHASTPDGEDTPEWKRQREGFAPEALYPDLDRTFQSSWYHSDFSDANIGNTLYRPLLGYTDKRLGGIINSLEDASGTVRDETQREALSRLRREHINISSEAQERAAWTYAQREIATQYETFLAIGAEPVDSGLLEDIKDRKVEDADDWAYLRAINTPSYQNPGAAKQDINTVDTVKKVEDTKGPFLTVRQTWVKQYRTECGQLAQR